MLIEIIFVSAIIILFIVLLYNKPRNNGTNNIKEKLDSDNCNYDYQKLFDKLNVCEDVNNIFYYCIPKNNKITLKCPKCINNIKECPEIEKNQSTYYQEDICPLPDFEENRCCKDKHGYYTGQVCEKGQIAGHYSSIYKYCSCE